jgi:glycosyltransferase involved in cell wall biosynthesis
MRILFLARNFYPEGNAVASRVYERACYWFKWGHKVTIITCFPTCADGKIFDGYRNKWCIKEIINGIRVIRVKTLITQKKTFLLKIIDNFVFMVMSFFLGLFEKNPDIICASSPQIFSAFNGWCLSFLKRVPFVFEVADLWPESLVAIKVLRKKSILAKLTHNLAIFLYRHSNKIVALTYHIEKRILSLGIEENKIKTIINGVDLGKYHPYEKDEYLLRKLNINGRMILGFLGTMRLEQDLAEVINCAELISEYNKNIIFIFVGEGNQKKDLIEMVKDKNIDNVIFIPRQPKSEINRFWGICDIALIPLMNDPLFSGALPSKMFEAMGMGLPILLIAPKGEASNIVLKENIGVWVEAGSHQNLANEILKLYNNKKQIQTYAKNSYKAASYYTRERQAREMLDVFKEFCEVR